MSTSGQRFQSHVEVFRRKTENINECTFWSSLQIFGSDSKLSHLDQQSESWTFRSQKIKYAYLIITGNFILENVLLFLELVRISNHALKGMI